MPRRRGTADAALRRAAAIYERSNDPMPQRIMQVYEHLSRLSLTRERFDDAIADARGWAALETPARPQPYVRTATAWVIARAHWGAGRSELALTHAREADRRAADLDDSPRSQALREEIRAWRAEHDPELGTRTP